VREVEEALCADACLFRQALAVDAEGGAMKQLVRVVDPARAKSADVVVGDSAQVFERSVHD
jgi:hypothetical protein